MITSYIVEPKFEFSYKYYEYKTPMNISVEYSRYKCFKKLTNHFNKAFNINVPDSLMPIILKGISENKNVHDPVLINLDYDNFIEAYPKEAKQFEKNEVNLIIDKLNNKVLKYVDKLQNIANDRKLNKVIEDEKVLLEIEDRGNTRIVLNLVLYNKMCDRYKNHNNEFNINVVDDLIWSVLFRQKYLGILEKWQGSINKEEINYLHDKYDVDVELFASLINSTLKYYGSLFYDVEKYFGSIGNFFNCTLIRGFFEMNPPTILWMVEKSFENIRAMLDKTSDLTIYTSTNVWDIYDREKLNKYCGTTKATDYPNPKLETLKRSKYIVIDHLYCQNIYKYIDYIGTKRNINTLQINVIVVSNKYKKGEIILPFLPDNYIES